MRFLVLTTATEVKNGNLNGSKSDVERGDTSKNKSFCKKTYNGIPYASSTSWKFGANQMLEEQYGVKMSYSINKKDMFKRSNDEIQEEEEENEKKKSKQQTIVEGNPYINYDEDLFGFMRTSSLIITKDQYEELPEGVKKIYSKCDKSKIDYIKYYTNNKRGKNKIELSEEEYNKLIEEEKDNFEEKSKEIKICVYQKDATKKRKAKVQMSTLQGSRRSVKEEYCTNKPNVGTNTVFIKEVYSDIMSQSFNVDLNGIGRFSTVVDKTGYIDYLPEELIEYGLKESGKGVVELPIEEKLNRINYFLTSVEKFNTSIKQTNNLEDLRPDFVILAELKVGNNPFLKIYSNGNLNTELLREELDALYDDDDLLSDVYIGVSSGFLTEEEEINLKNVIDELEIKYDKKIHLDNVHKTFKVYKSNLKL